MTDSSFVKKTLAITLVLAVIAGVAFFAVGIINKRNDKAELSELRVKNIELPYYMKVTAQTGCLGTEEDSFLSVKTGIGAGAQMVSINVAFTEKGIPVLAGSLEKANNEAVELERIFEFVSDMEEISIIINLKEITNLPVVEKMVKDYSMQGRIFFSGITVHHVPYVVKKCPSVGIFLDIEPEKRKLKDPEYCIEIAERAMSAGASGVKCEFDKTNAFLGDTLKTYGIILCVTGAETELDFYRALDRGATNIITKEPKMLLAILQRIRETAEVSKNTTE